MSTASRHDMILRLLRRQGSTTARALALATGASRRTILRDIGALREQGYLIHADPGRAGGLRLDPGSAPMTARLAVTEVFALLLCVTAMKAARNLPFADLADAGLARIERSLSRDQVRDLRAMLACLHIGPLSPHQDLSDLGPMDPGLLPAFETGFLQRRPLHFSYRDRHGVTTDRQVEPQALLILPPLWYLVAWDPSRQGFRHFRMDRIAAPRLAEGPPFRRRHVPFDQDICPWAELDRRLAG